jgi:hypothetical protein
MLRNLKDLENDSINATDGEIGHVKDFFFDDDAWVIRYLVVDTGSWFESRKVLISPICVDPSNRADRTLPVSLTKEQVKNSPSIDTDQPVSRQHEEQILGYYGYANYWDGAGMWGGGMYPFAMEPGYVGLGGDPLDGEWDIAAHLRAERARHRNDDPHLRSANEVIGYHLQATDGEIGHVTGYLVDEQTWAIRYLIVDTSNWWMGHKVLIAPEWISGVHWSGRSVSVDLSRESVKAAPPYETDTAWSRQSDAELYGHYGRAGYW